MEVAQDVSRKAHDGARRPAIATLKYLSHNLGDDIQAFALAQQIGANHESFRERLHRSPFDPALDDAALDDAEAAEREAVKREAGANDVAGDVSHDTPNAGAQTSQPTIVPGDAELLLFGWLLHSENWPPHPDYRVHSIGVHLAFQKHPLFTESIEWWRQQCAATGLPVSCRDSSTAHFLLENDVPAELHGCVTLSLERWLEPVSDLVVVTDVVGDVPTLNFGRKVEQTHFVPRPRHRNRRFRRRMTKQVLRAYQRATMVVTSRLHVTLPCLAFGTPVVFVPPRLEARRSNSTRFVDFLPYVEVWDGQKEYGPNELPVNYSPDALIASVQQRLEAVRRSLRVAKPEPIPSDRGA